MILKNKEALGYIILYLGCLVVLLIEVLQMKCGLGYIYQHVLSVDAYFTLLRMSAYVQPVKQVVMILTFEEVFILKDEENNVLGQISFDTLTDQWVFMPDSKPLLKDDIAKINDKMLELAKPGLIKMFDKKEQ